MVTLWIEHCTPLGDSCRTTDESIARIGVAVRNTCCRFRVAVTARGASFATFLAESGIVRVVSRCGGAVWAGG